MSLWACFPHKESLEMPFGVTKGFSCTVSCQESKIPSAGASRAEDFGGTDEQMTEISPARVKRSRVKRQKVSSDTCWNVNGLTLSSLHYITHNLSLHQWKYSWKMEFEQPGNQWRAAKQHSSKHRGIVWTQLENTSPFRILNSTSNDSLKWKQAPHFKMRNKSSEVINLLIFLKHSTLRLNRRGNSNYSLSSSFKQSRVPFREMYGDNNSRLIACKPSKLKKAVSAEKEHKDHKSLYLLERTVVRKM